MKRTQGKVDIEEQKRQQARQGLGQVSMSQVASVPQLRQVVQQLLDYLDVPYQP
ncbi:MAG: hypothetical protein ACE5IZ_11515 [Dehalococcoidia bacterium]